LISNSSNNQENSKGKIATFKEYCSKHVRKIKNALNLSAEPPEKVLVFENSNQNSSTSQYFDHENNKVMGIKMSNVFSTVLTSMMDLGKKIPQRSKKLNLSTEKLNLDKKFSSLDKIEDYKEMESNLNSNKKLNSTLQDQEMKNNLTSDEENNSLPSLTTSCEDLKNELAKKQEEIYSECGIGMRSKLIDSFDIERIQTECNYENKIHFKEKRKSSSSKVSKTTN